MAENMLSLLQGPEMDWTEDCKLHKWYINWKEEVLLALQTLSPDITPKTEVKYVMLWAGKRACRYLNTVEEHNKDSVDTLLQTLENWFKPKTNELITFTELIQLNQGNLSVSQFIEEVMCLVELCNFKCNLFKKKLIRNCVLSGIKDLNSYQQCLLQENCLTLLHSTVICNCGNNSSTP